MTGPDRCLLPLTLVLTLGALAVAQDVVPAPAVPAPDPAREAFLSDVRAEVSALVAEFPERRAAAEAILERWFPAGKRGASPSLDSARGAAVRPALEGVADLGLAWLAAHQSRGGGWSGASFAEDCGHLAPGGTCSGPGAPLYDSGLTGLALLCFLRRGHTADEGRYASVVQRGLDDLLALQGPDGCFDVRQAPTGTYNHLIASLALFEALPHGDAARLREPAERALALIQDLRNTGAAWRYWAGDPEMDNRANDTSVTSWAVQAIVAARAAGLVVGTQSLADAKKYLDDMTDPVTGRTGYYDRGGLSARVAGEGEVFPGDKTEAMTAAALLSRSLISRTRKFAGHEAELVQKGLALIAGNRPAWGDKAQAGRIDFYYWHGATLALARLGGEDWSLWKRDLVRVLIDHVQLSGDDAGSWPPEVTAWGHDGGRVFSTCMLTLAAIEAAKTD